MTVKVTQPSINVREKISELDKPSGTAGQAMLAAETPREQFNLIGAGRRNLIINGAMQVAQRGTASPGNPGQGYHTCDRWITEYDSGNVSATFSQASSTSGAPGFIYSQKCAINNTLTLPTGSYLIPFEQRFERNMIDQLAWGTSNAKQLTLSFWIKSNRIGTYTVNPTIDSPTDVNGQSITKQYTIDAADTWEHKKIVFPANTAAYPNVSSYNTKAFTLFWWMAAGSTYSSGTLPTGWKTEVASERAVGCTNSLSSGDYWEITGVQLEAGKVATPFEHRSYGEELALCQRYYYDAGLQPIDLVGVGHSSGYSGVTSGRITFPVTMRATPSYTRTVTQSSYSSTPNRTIVTPQAFYQTSQNMSSTEYLYQHQFKFTAEL